jgi:hypothetical protein
MSCGTNFMIFVISSTFQVRKGISNHVGSILRHKTRELHHGDQKEAAFSNDSTIQVIHRKSYEFM